jgi:hypothetical protein
MIDWLSKYWCSWFHGGGKIERDCYDRVNWRCCKCKRWADTTHFGGRAFGK